MPVDVVLEARSVSVTYRRRRRVVFSLPPLDLEVRRGRAALLAGQSGSGKSTVLRVIGGLQRPDAGSVVWSPLDADLYALPAARRAAVRGARIGFLFQSVNLLPEFDAATNAAIPLLIAGVSRSRALARARELLAAFGVEHRALHRPHELSGGEQRRVGLARALVGEPDVLLGDEPFADVDEANRELMRAAIQGLLARGGSVVLASHVAVPLEAEIIRIGMMGVAPGADVREQATAGG